MIRYCYLWLALMLSPHSAVAALDHDYVKWTGLLQESVTWNAAGSATDVNYSRLRQQQSSLTALLAEFSAVTLTQYQSWSVAQRRAFLINAYNAWTVQRILQAESLPASIRDLGSFFTSVWKQRFFTLLGKQRSLDEIEHELLRGAQDYDDPRIHFAVNCASIGCPALRPEAYVAKRLEQQLDDQTRRFLSDADRNYFDPSTQTFYLSKIFDWYTEDFERGLLGSESVLTFLQTYAKELGAERAVLDAKQISIEYTEYDWKLNGQ
jgi:hypothetical protein